MKTQTTKKFVSSRLPSVVPKIVKNDSYIAPKNKRLSIWHVYDEHGASMCGCGCGGCFKITRKFRKN